MDFEKTNEIENKPQPTWIKAILRVVKFANRHKKVLAIVIGSVVILLTAYFMIPSIDVGGNTIVNLGTEVRLDKTQIAQLKTADVSVKINNFNNSPCPTGQKCFGEGQKNVEYLLTVDNQKYAVGSLNTDNSSKYRVETVKTDYKTYATIKILELN